VLLILDHPREKNNVRMRVDGKRKENWENIASMRRPAGSIHYICEDEKSFTPV
jgi:hypothetical protein